MEIGPGTEDLAVEEASDREEFSELLRALRARAGSPSLRTLEKETATAARPLVPLRRSSFAEVLQGQRFPQRAVLATFLHTCGVQGAEAQRWMRAWERLAPAYAPANRNEDDRAEQERAAEAVLEQVQTEAAEVVAQARRQAEHEAKQIRARALKEAQRIREQSSPEIGALPEGVEKQDRPARSGHVGAMFNLGRLLEQRGDTLMAAHWYEKAAEAEGG
ncbi:ATP synthase F0 subunit B [Nocardiopsis sp. RSe5-2]|uniref:ATP synthase F0 subunit B n=1 Tax=Nocardiopsis endophytica TaxID=3018445 RepID=A0ABT4TZU1_9ACTN|nr:ATP synthase F0 subunit B [Nocardiopsis endophytica]MDA2809946.1 ATP synthase F0 subunit B [Nocardiopsis endophytica]